MKKLIFSLVIFASVSSFAKAITYHIDVKNWPDRKQIMTPVEELASSGHCYDINGKNVSEKDHDCRKFAVYKSKDVFKKNTKDMKMVIGYGKDEMRVMIFKWEGAKFQQVLNSGKKITAEDLKSELIKWSFK